MAAESLSIVIPAYNEGPDVGAVVDECRALFEAHGWTGEIVACDDGSRDDTLEVLRERARENPFLRVLSHPVNRGVGETLRTLYREARGDLVCFLPADGQVRPSQVPALLAGLGRFDVVIGHRVRRRDPFWRCWSAAVYNASLRVLFGLRIRDVDSVTLFRRETLEVDAARCRGIVMCAELLLWARARGFRIGEVPVEHQARLRGEQTGGRPGFIFMAMRELVLLRLRLWMERPSTPAARGAHRP